MLNILFLLPAIVLARAIVPHDISSQEHYSCQQFSIPVNVTDATTFALPFPDFASQYAATSISDSLSGRHASPSTLTVAETNFTNSYTISAEYCTPASGIPQSSTLQILTHGLGFNRSYWEFIPSDNTSDSQYNYISAATAAGYPTLSYNRLGIRGSSMANPYNETQLLVELQVLTAITSAAREGNLPIANVTKPSKILHVGHSFGSQLGIALARYYPTLSDGLVLTGVSANSTWASLLIANSALRIAAELDSTAYPSSYYASGYVTWTTQYDNQYSFFHYPAFDPKVLEQAEATKQPIGIGELVVSPPPADASNFTGPVLYLNGQFDLIMCGANCTGIVGPNTTSFEIFSASRNVESTILPDFGHAINLHYNASGMAYAPIMEWAAKNGFQDCKYDQF